MRLRFKATAEQRTALSKRLERVQRSEVVLAMLEGCLPSDFTPKRVTCTPQRVHSDRFVVRVRLYGTAGEERAYALKVYSDDFGREVWTYAQKLAAHYASDEDGPCLPIRYLSEERTLIFPWIEGASLSKMVDSRKPTLLARAAKLAAHLHRLPVVPEEPTPLETILADTEARCGRLTTRWPAATSLVEPLWSAVQEASTGLDPAEPAPVHGDLAAGQFLWTGDRLVALDLDMFGFTDPAYDVGHFLGQLERRCRLDPSLPAHSREWTRCFRHAYLAAMPYVSPDNVEFYRGLTLLRKIYTICRRHPGEWRELAPHLATGAWNALRAIESETLLQ